VKLALTVVPMDLTFMIEVAPAVYNRAVAGALYFQEKILDLARIGLPAHAVRDLHWNDVVIGRPASAE
jgi:hypothetical protein